MLYYIGYEQEAAGRNTLYYFNFADNMIYTAEKGSKASGTAGSAWICLLAGPTATLLERLSRGSALYRGTAADLWVFALILLATAAVYQPFRRKKEKKITDGAQSLYPYRNLTERLRALERRRNIIVYPMLAILILLAIGSLILMMEDGLSLLVYFSVCMLLSAVSLALCVMDPVGGLRWKRRIRRLRRRDQGL